MSKIKNGQSIAGRMVDVLNREFGARNGNGQALNAWQHAVWPKGEPFLVNTKDKSRDASVVWFPVVTDDSNVMPKSGWLNLANKDRSVITTTYVGDKPLDEVENVASRYVGMNHIVFARWQKPDAGLEFLGVYSCTKKDHVRTYRRIADAIDTSEWERR